MRSFVKNLKNNPLFFGSAIMILGSNSANAINYLYHLIIGRLLGPAEYGVLASLISISGILGIIPSVLSLVSIKYISSSRTTQEQSILINWLKDIVFKLSIICFIFIVVTSPIIKSFLHLDKIIYIFLIALTFLFSLPTFLNRSILQGLLRFKEMITSILLENTVRLLSGILLVYLGYRVSGAMVGFVIASIICWYITNKFLSSLPKGSMKTPTNIKSIAAYTLPVIIQSFALNSLIYSDLILVKHFLPSYDTGIYAALSTLGKIIFFGAGPISAVMFPLVSQKKSRSENYKRIFIYSFFITFIFAAAMLFIYWLFPTLVINLLYGKAYIEASYLLIWFGIFMSLFILSSLLINYCLSLDRTSVVFFPVIAALSQLIFICFFHQNLFTIILISVVVTALLLFSLLLYSSYDKGYR